MLINIYMKFHEDIFNGFQVTGRIRFCDGQTDGWTDERGKNNMSPNPEGGRHKFEVFYIDCDLRVISLCLHVFVTLQMLNKSFSYQDTPPLRSFLVYILNFDNKTSKIFSKCNNLFGRYLGETHFVHKLRAVTRLKNKEKQNVIG